MRLALVFCWAVCACAQAPDIGLFIQAAQENDVLATSALNQIGAVWRDGYGAMFVDIAHLLTPLPGGTQTASNQRIRQRLIRFLESKTGKRFGEDLDKWRNWMWRLPYAPHPDYAAFKAQIYSNIDSEMGQFFQPKSASLVRLDEIDWGGVKVNGIPPLVYPKLVSAADARYLDDNDTVFGFWVNGEARAYPKRILAWHELARDRLGGVELTIVYCTLCGTVLPYESVAGGKLRVLGTSGLLYQSNKLMFDEETHSLWSTLTGRPVVGLLVNTGIELKLRPAVTTKWKEWRTMHPATTVLSRETGFQRDYSEGAAYHDYFATDRLMFQVSRQDKRLRNKDEVLVMKLGNREPVAISSAFLRRTPVFHYQGVVVLTTPEGANRVYASGGVQFRSFADNKVLDSAGRSWLVTEDGLKAEIGDRVLTRQPAHRAFWFAWFAQFPDTALVK